MAKSQKFKTKNKNIGFRSYIIFFDSKQKGGARCQTLLLNILYTPPN